MQQYHCVCVCARAGVTFLFTCVLVAVGLGNVKARTVVLDEMLQQPLWRLVMSRCQRTCPWYRGTRTGRWRQQLGDWGQSHCQKAVSLSCVVVQYLQSSSSGYNAKTLRLSLSASMLGM